jgi:hypothetical protein
MPPPDGVDGLVRDPGATLSLVIPAQTGTQRLCSRSVIAQWFRSPPRRAGYFLLRQKVVKDHRACGDGLGNVVLPRLPCDARRMAAAPRLLATSLWLAPR